MGDCLSFLSKPCAFEKDVKNMLAVQERIAKSLEKILEKQDLALLNSKKDAMVFEKMLESLLGDSDSESEAIPGSDWSSMESDRGNNSRLLHAILSIKDFRGIPSIPRGSPSQEIPRDPKESHGIPRDPRGNLGEARRSQEVPWNPRGSQDLEIPTF